jgi:hypothetical protein
MGSNPAAGWTPERRKRQREAIHRWKPWSQSTGPTTPEGKAVVSRNAYTGGELVALRAAIKFFNEAMREQRNLVVRNLG